MFRSFLSWRYLSARRTNLIGIVGIFVGVGALILILSIMTGFLDQSRATVRGSLSDLVISPIPTGLGAPPAAGSPERLLEALRTTDGVAAAAPHLNWFGLVTLPGREAEISDRLFQSSTHGATSGVQLVGIDVRTADKVAWTAGRAALALAGLRTAPARLQDELDATEFLAAITREPKTDATVVDSRVADPLRPFAPPPRYEPEGRPKASVIVGEQLFHSLYLSRGSEIQISTAVLDPDSREWTFNNREFVVAGTFRSRDNEMDLGRIYLERSELSDLLGGTQRFSEVLVKLEDYPREGELVRDGLRRDLAEQGLISGLRGGVFEVRTWEEFRGNLLGAIENERVLMAIMLSLVLLVAGFTVFAILSMMVTEKRRDIGILCAIGATPRGILDVFLMIAFWDALIGAVLGAVVGTWGAIKIDAMERWLSRHLDFWPFPPEGVQIFNRDVYLFDHIPSNVDPLAVGLIVLGAFSCALLFAALPAVRAARLDPLEALRYE